MELLSHLMLPPPIDTKWVVFYEGDEYVRYLRGLWHYWECKQGHGLTLDLAFPWASNRKGDNVYMEVTPRIDDEGTNSQWVRRRGISPFSLKEHKSHEALVKEECQALSTRCIKLSTPGVRRWGLRFPGEVRRARCRQCVNKQRFREVRAVEA
jgi:hypothetical protein